MRIFTAVRHSINPRFYYGGLWSGNFYPALRQTGCEIVESEVDLLPASRFMDVRGNFTHEEKEVRARITQKIIDEVKKTHKKEPISLFLSYFYNAHFDPEGFGEIHKLGIPSVNFYCNSIYQFDLVDKIARKVNFSWHTEKHARQLYLEANANPVWVQMAADPEIYHPVTGIKREPKACFVGQRYADRLRWLAQLIAGDTPVDIYGSGWDKQRMQKKDTFYLGRRHAGPGTPRAYIDVMLESIKNNGLSKGIKNIAGQLGYKNKDRRLAALITPHVRGFAEDISKTFANYEVVINFSNIWRDGRPGSEPVPHVRLRDFEGPMCRACYLTGHADEISEFYELGKEIETYQTPEELAEKIKFYIKKPVLAENLREAGYRRALKDHTWKQRFKSLFEKIGIKSQ